MTWTDNREVELQGIMANLVPLQDSGLITTLDRNPSGKIISSQMDAVLLFEGVDNVTKNVSNSSIGPQNRQLQIVFELWTYNSSNDITAKFIQLRTLYNEVRKAACRKRALFEQSLTPIYNGTEPGVIGIGIVTFLRYINNGN